MKGGRKMKMLQWSYWFVGSLVIVYLGVCLVIKVAPDGNVLAAAFIAGGAGHSSANWANSKEYSKPE